MSAFSRGGLISANYAPFDNYATLQRGRLTALRVAEEVVSAFTGLYLDGDMILAAASAGRVLERLRIRIALAATPPIKYDSERSSRLISSYGRAWAGLHAVIPSLWGRRVRAV